jgi:endonuclease G
MAETVKDAFLEQVRAAAARIAEHDTAAARTRVVDAIARRAGLEEFNDPERLARRLDRLSRYFAREQVPMTPDEVPTRPAEEVIARAIDRAATDADATMSGAADVAAAAAESDAEARAGGAETLVPERGIEHRAGVVLEAIIGSQDYVGIRYLEAGVAAARAVCRVHIRDARGRAGFGSGSLVSPRLLLTNHHVLESAEVARLSRAEFNYQDGLDGQPLQARIFELDPDTFFLADRERDFALVAVSAGDRGLAQFGFNRLIEAEGKAVLGEFLTIIQHPAGEKKQIALRENRIVGLLELFVHYKTDTKPGSSGSPVFNDQWEVVALHHASVPAPAGEPVGQIINEGIRASRILRFVKEQRRPRAQQAFVDQLFAPESIILPAAEPVLTAPQAPTREPGEASNTVKIDLPLEITITVSARPPQTLPSAPDEPLEPSEPAEEAVVIDRDYTNRRGYREDFLGGDHSVPLPTLSKKLLKKAAKIETGSDRGAFVLPYHHFSVVMNRERRLAFFTGVNIDGRTGVDLKRETDKWSLDPRLRPDDQIGEEAYADNDLDRGHLVRRIDPAWGRTRTLAKRANDDTFHFTNCTPQHKNFNQNRTTWAGLENYILNNAANRRFRASVFTGAVFADDDDDYRGVKLPRQFWKVAVMVKENDELSATAYLLSQADLLRGLEAVGDFSYGAYRTYQVPVRRVEELTGISFGDLTRSDPLAGLEAATGEREISHLDELVL